MRIAEAIEKPWPEDKMTGETASISSTLENKGDHGSLDVVDLLRRESADGEGISNTLVKIARKE